VRRAAPRRAVADCTNRAERILLEQGFSPQEALMAGKSIKNKRKYSALKRKGMSKSRAARISNAGPSASRKGGRKGGKKKKR
jgi:hypothetical protein